MAAQLLSPAVWGLLNCFPDSTVVLVNADGSGCDQSRGAGGSARPSWSPDGMRIAFGSSACPECPSTIHYVTRDGSQSGVLISNAHSPTWRPSTSGFDAALVASHSQKCLDVSAGSLNDGASLIQWQCHGGAQPAVASRGRWRRLLADCLAGQRQVPGRQRRIAR